MWCRLMLAWSLLAASSFVIAAPGGDFLFGQCEPIRIEMCQSLGYNETSMPNLAGNEMQLEAKYTLDSFSPLIEYACSSQLKLFLCATYVPMCTPKAPVPIGPCRSLCESVRSRCDPVLQGFGYLWPPALDCSHFPKENNQDTMCMEGPGESQEVASVGEASPGFNAVNVHSQDSSLGTGVGFECPGYSKLYAKLYRSWRCAPLCEANILFGPKEKHVAEVWTNTWTYAALALALIAIACMIFSESKSTKACETKKVRVLNCLLWCHTMVAVGWTVRFVAGRTATSCGYDPQLPNVLLLLVDGLSNGPCAVTFLLRYYFGMAACAWWAILCLGWHRDIRRNSPDMMGHITVGGIASSIANNNGASVKQNRVNSAENVITTSNLARFLAWGLPAFQTAAVIVARLVDADELLGSCYVGNQSDKGLQVLVATPLFCYWIFGSMNLASGFLVHRRNKEILRTTNSNSIRMLLQNNSTISGTFLFIYCLPSALLLLAVIYEFANIDVWLKISPYINAIRNTTIISSETPMWPFLARAFMELMLVIICSAWVLGPKISNIYKRRLGKPQVKTQPLSLQSLTVPPSLTAPDKVSRSSYKANSTASYHSLRHPVSVHSKSKQVLTSGMAKKHPSNYTVARNLSPKRSHIYAHLANKSSAQSFSPYGDETIL